MTTSQSHRIGNPASAAASYLAVRAGPAAGATGCGTDCSSIHWEPSPATRQPGQLGNGPALAASDRRRRPPRRMNIHVPGRRRPAGRAGRLPRHAATVTAPAAPELTWTEPVTSESGTVRVAFESLARHRWRDRHATGGMTGTGGRWPPKSGLQALASRGGSPAAGL